MSSKTISETTGESPIDPVQQLLTGIINSKDPVLSELFPLLVPEFDPSKETVIVLLGPSGAGKDSLLREIDEIQRITTATTRLPRYKVEDRLSGVVEDLFKQFNSSVIYQLTILSHYYPDEQFDRLSRETYERRVKEFYNYLIDNHLITDFEDLSEYTWMRPQLLWEDNDTYFRNIIKQYELIEHDRHFLRIYGLPKSNVTDSIDNGKVRCIRTEPNAIDSIRDSLSERFNLVFVSVVPDRFNAIETAIRNRSSNLPEDEIATRVNEELEKLNKYFDHNINFVIVNPRQEVAPRSKPNLTRQIAAFRKVIELATRNSYRLV